MLLVAGAALSLIPAVYLFAQSAASTAGTSGRNVTLHGAESELATQILDLETKRVTAMVKKDIGALDALLADDLTYTHSGGTTDTKASFVALIRDRGRYLGVDYTHKEVVPLNASTVMVRGLAIIRLEETPPYPVLFMDVWALRGGAWRMVAWQATRVPEPARSQTN
jgi:hypothetical protein